MPRPRFTVALLAAVLASVLAAGCGAPARQAWENTFKGDGEDAFLLDDDFVCLGDLRFTKVEKFRVWNALGHQTDALTVAESGRAGVYPVGTVVQLSPVEAMVKRGAGFSRETADWEFLQLNVDSGETVITARGTTALANPGGSCLGCHQPAADTGFDFVCGTNSACAPLPFFIDTDVDPDTDDPRCGHD